MKETILESGDSVFERGDKEHNHPVQSDQVLNCLIRKEGCKNGIDDMFKPAGHALNQAKRKFIRPGKDWNSLKLLVRHIQSHTQIPVLRT